jgi:uracil-DNA glycosylase
MEFTISTDWNVILQHNYLTHIKDNLKKVENKIYPENEKIFNAFNHFDQKDLKVVIIGQDCYHGEGQANGLCFSVNDDVKTPPSLRNILNEMNKDLNIKRTNKDFTDLANQGVLLINSALTVEEGKPGSHLKLWQPYTNYIIDYISKNHKDIIFVLWGNYAKKKRVIIDLSKHYTIESNHPSPLSANRGGWFNTKPFSQINNKLKELGKKEIIWG